LQSLPTDRSDQQPVALTDILSAPVLPTSVHPTEPVLLGMQQRAQRGDIVLLNLPEDLAAGGTATDADFENVFETSFDERFATFSPDGRWIAYSSDESGESQVYVVPYGGGRKAQVSVDGGRMPRWNPAGGELFFLDDAGLMVAAVEPVAIGEAFDSGIPVRLFENAALVGFAPETDFFTYDVFPDGSEFVFLSGANASETGSIFLRVVENWFDELNELSPLPD
jgi:hypothetical protein